MLLGSVVGPDREALVGGQGALVDAGALEVLGDRTGDGGGDGRRYRVSERLAGDDALDGGGAEGAVAGGVAQCLGDTGHARPLAQLEDAAHVVAGGAAAPLAKTLDEARGGVAQAPELLLEQVSAGARLAELLLVLGQHVTLVPGAL